MEAKQEALRGFLLVPSVQELAKESPTTVPDRFIQDSPITSYVPSTPDVPIINMEKLLSGDHMELEKLDSACKEWGFFQLINHGVSSVLLEKVKVEMYELFNLPMEEKKKFREDSTDFEGFMQFNVFSEEQKIEWRDIDTFEIYANELKDLAMEIVDIMSKCLKMKTEEMRDLFEDGWQLMGMNYYPPCSQPEKVTGATAHSDAVGLTILLQLNEMEGLQVKKDGLWAPIKPLPQAFVVNVGDIIEILTNGAYPSIEHRAVVNSTKERLSLATFYSPGFEKEIGPAASLITPQAPALYRRMGVGEYFKGFLSRKLDGRSNIDVMRIEN